MTTPKFYNIDAERYNAALSLSLGVLKPDLRWVKNNLSEHLTFDIVGGLTPLVILQSRDNFGEFLKATEEDIVEVEKLCNALTSMRNNPDIRDNPAEEATSFCLWAKLMVQSLELTVLIPAGRKIKSVDKINVGLLKEGEGKENAVRIINKYAAGMVFDKTINQPHGAVTVRNGGEDLRLAFATLYESDSRFNLYTQYQIQQVRNDRRSDLPYISPAGIDEDGLNKLKTEFADMGINFPGAASFLEKQ